MEAWSGSDVASTLLNLRNHRERTERLRYDQIVQLFSLLVPRYKVEAVESQPGSPVPEILFYEKGQAEPISLEAVSAGLHQILAWVSSLVGRRDLVVFVEHPEEHLHPHSIRFLRKLLSDNSADNQIILTTHTPYAIDPLFPESLRRFWWGSQGSSCRWIDRTSVADPDYGRMRRALRSVGDREMVFSRAVVLTEEETTQQFLLGVAPTHEMNLDADGVSVISVGGDAGFKPYRTLLDGLGIPYVCQRDRSWGQHPDYPPDRYFALDSPGFEAFMDGQGFLALRREVEMEVGTSKPRVAGELASRLTKDQVPSVFVQVLTTAVALAKSA